MLVVVAPVYPLIVAIVADWIPGLRRAGFRLQLLVGLKGESWSGLYCSPQCAVPPQE
jgi:hypothetical protein